MRNMEVTLMAETTVWPMFTPRSMITPLTGEQMVQ